jgi:hypothetical protein
MPQSDPRNYSHRRLKDLRTIRLLKLKSWTPLSKHDAPLKYELIDTSLDNVPTFFAVSYAWDAQIPTSAIECEGYVLLVTANCHAALSHVSRNTPLRLLWVDSVCIDQTNVEEQGQQVALMAEIYHKAKEVLIWLGDSNEDSEVTMKALGKLSRLARFFPKVVESKFKKIQESRRARVLVPFENDNIPLSTLLPDYYLFGLHSMSAVSDRSWFQRIWTLQEIVLARKAVVICGARSISWDSLALLADTITEGDASAGFTEYPGDSFQRVRVVSALRSLLKIGPRKAALSYRLPKEHPFGSMTVRLPPSDTLPILGIASHYFLASLLETAKSQDKVYGLYAILQQYGVKLPAPDYSKASSTIYHETARALIECDSSLELLYYATIQRVLRDLPSWVPDPTSPVVSWIPGFEYTLSAGRSRSKFRFSPEGKLSIYGYAVDTIANVSRSMSVPMTINVEKHQIYQPDLILRNYHTVIEHVQEFIRFALATGYVTAYDPLEAFCMVSIQDIAFAFRGDGTGADWRKVLEFFRDWVMAMTSTMGWEPEQSQAESPDSPPLSASPGAESKTESDDTSGTQTPTAAVDTSSISQDTLIDDSSTSLDDAEVARELQEAAKAADRSIFTHLSQCPATRMIHHAFLQRSDGNALFNTISGRLGMTIRGIQEGDKVVLVAGLRLPMILAEEQDGWRVIGVAYLHGVMQGELWTEKEEGRWMEEFVLI